MIEEHYKENYKSLFSFAYKALGDFHYGEDCVQEAFEMALKYEKTFNPDKGNFGSWFHMILLNSIRKYGNFIRDKGVVMELKVKDHPLYPDSIIDRYRNLVEEEIDQYGKNDRVRNLLFMYVVMGYSGEEVAELCGTTCNSVRQHATRFKKHLLEKYDEVT